MESIGAARGRRTGKSGQSDYYVGYKKHTAVGFLQIDGHWRGVPLASRVTAANRGDVELITSLFRATQTATRNFWPIHIVLGDKGYTSARDARWLRQEHGVAFVVRPKADLVPPVGTDPDGCPLCPAGERLIWDEYDQADEMLIYRADECVCGACGLRGTCPRQFDFDAGRHETFWGMIPTHSRLARLLLRQFRPLVEPNFYQSKVRHALARLFLNSPEFTDSVGKMSDLIQTLEILAPKKPMRGLQAKNSTLREVKQPELWD